MKINMKYFFYVITAVFLVTMVIMMMMFFNPLRRSSESIRKSLLQLTPDGTRMDDVIMVINNHEKWKLRYVCYNESRHIRAIGVSFENKDIAGRQSIEAYLGYYSTILDTAVYAFWDFDSNGKLVDIYVWKDKDTL